MYKRQVAVGAAAGAGGSADGDGVDADASAYVDDAEGAIEGPVYYYVPGSYVYEPPEVVARAEADVDLEGGGAAGAVEAAAAAERAGGATDADVALSGAGDAPLDGSADASAVEPPAR